MTATADRANLLNRDEKLGNALPVPHLPPRMLMDLQEGYCNLKCPKCIVHGPDDNEAIKAIRGYMSVEDARKILDEVMEAKPLIQPILWSEPLLSKNFREHMTAMKERGIAVAMNTNGLLLTEDIAQFFVDIKLDSVFISIDATTKETLEKVRGVDRLDKIHNAVFTMLRVRGEATYPRIGVSFVIEKENLHEKDEFVAYWSQYVDVVRVNEFYEGGRWQNNIPIPEKRVPCQSLYHTMAVHHNGNVSVCCLDGFGETNLGNVFKEGVKGVWHGEKFQNVRHYHETGQYDKVPFCKNCNVWANYQYEEEMVDNLLIRRAPGMTYYNRLDRLSAWRCGLLGGHTSELKGDAIDFSDQTVN
ncbi:MULTISPECIES: radical SAM protein [unclassified Microcoleus]|uniref:radical SAM protein n=1 Tax=unclassified Microcoleus TaxID=2642155 RepID=UPI002FD4801C